MFARDAHYIKATLLICLFTWANSFLRSQVSQPMPVFRAGASVSNITPVLGDPIVGNYQTPPASYIHDQLNVRTLVLDDGKDIIIFSIVDNVSVAREVYDAAKAMVRNKHKIPFENMLFAATHTHSGTSAEKEGDARRGWHFGEPLDRYQLFLAQRIADGVQTAIENLEPALFGWGSVEVPEHVFNRRWIMRDSVMNPLGHKDIAKMNPGIDHPDLVRPAGPTDPELNFLMVTSPGGRPIALLANYSLHYVGGVPPGHISADYFAVFADRIQVLLAADRQDPPFVGILSNGTSGDINNINWPGPKADPFPPYKKMEYVAYDLAEKVMENKGSLVFQTWVDLEGTMSKVPLKVRRADKTLLEKLERVRNRPLDDPPLFHPLEKIYADRIEILERDWPDDIEIVLQTLKIGELAVAAIPFEVFAETGLEIKGKSPFASTFTIELANGAYGYLPTPGQHLLGGYETWLSTNRVQENASELIVEEILHLLEDMQK